jgi:hypothetical protein
MFAIVIYHHEATARHPEGGKEASSIQNAVAETFLMFEYCMLLFISHK